MLEFSEIVLLQCMLRMRCDFDLSVPMTTVLLDFDVSFSKLSLKLESFYFIRITRHAYVSSTGSPLYNEN